METIKRTYTIDFKQQSNATEVLHQGLIKTDEIKKFGIKRMPNYNLKYFGITNLQIDSSIVINPSVDVVFIRCKGKDKKFFENLPVTEYDMPYDIIFNRLAVEDYSNFESNKAKISFSLESQDETESKPTAKLNFALELVFRKGVSVPDLNVILADSFDVGEQYINHDKVKCGNLQIELNSEIAYSSNISQLDAKCFLREILYKDIVSFGSKNEITESNPWTGDTGITTNAEVRSSLMIQKENEIVRLANITPNNTIKIPLYIDLSKFPVPREPKEEELIISINYFADGRSFSEEIKKTLKIIPNTTQTALMWNCNDGGEEIVLEESLNIDHTTSWQKDEEGSMECFTLLLGNVASESDNGGKVLVNNFKMTINYDNDKGYSTIIVPNSAVDYNSKDLSFLRINGKQLDTLPKNFIFKDGSSPKEMVLEFDNEDIIDIPNGVAKLNLNISFDYTVINRDEAEEKGKVNTCIKFRLFKDTGDHWIALDFGTSATVTAFADSEAIETQNIESLILDMQKSLKKNLGSSYVKDDIKESNTRFLSSEILLRLANDVKYKKASLSGTVFNNNLIELSPLNNRITSSKSVLPYLKSLIGSRVIPNLNGYEYRKFKDGKIIKNERDPLLLNDVLINTYQSLITDFVLPAIRENDRDKANKIIFTIPNTFTPKHTNLIKEVIEHKSDQFNKHFISFVSESDAVLSYYLKSWSGLNTNRESIESYKTGDKDEYVFVYDMGAGTLDLTYAKISRNNEGKTYVDIIGRLGTTTAGNYFDAVIAKAIHKLDGAEEFFAVNDLLDTADMDAASKNKMAYLKEAIKNEVKPLLNDAEGIIYASQNVQGKIIYSRQQSADLFNDGGAFEIKISELLASDEIQHFVDKNSEKLLDVFFDLYADPQRMGENFVKGHFQIDTVLFTGRAIQFDVLRNEVEKELKEWSKEPDDMYVIYREQSKELKNIVVKGALQYATSYRDRAGNSTQINNRNIQARYGVLTKDSIGKWIFDEFINPTTKPSSPNYYFKDGITIYKYDTRVHSENTRGDTIDMSHSPVAFFVQSYSNDTATDVTNNNWEFITKMFSIKRASIHLADRSNVPVRVQVDEENNMIVKIGPKNFGKREPLSINTENNNTFKMSMWPFM